MGYPIQTQVFSVFLGTQEGIHSVALPAIYSSSGSRNLWIDKLGRAKKILGYSKQNSSAVTTNTGGSATRLRALRAYRKTESDGTFTRQLLGLFDDGTNECELWYSTNDGAAWTFIADFGSGSVGAIPDFAQVDNTLFFADGQYRFGATERILHLEDGEYGWGRGTISRVCDLEHHSATGREVQSLMDGR